MTSSSTLRRGAGSTLAVIGRLTERDRLLCRVLWEHRVLTTEQICQLAFTALTSTQHRLVTLWRLGVLERFRSVRPLGSESWRYTLGPVGAAVVAAERGVDPPRPSVLAARVVALAAGQRTEHTLGVNGLFTALHAAARQRTEVRVAEWWSERRCAAEWGELVRPDAFGAYEEGSARVEFFVEYDTGTETLARVAAKLAGYRDLVEAEDIARPVLFLVARPGREPGLRRALQGTPLPVATAATGQDPAGPIWLPIGVEAPRRRLVELAASGPSSRR